MLRIISAIKIFYRKCPFDKKEHLYHVRLNTYTLAEGRQKAAGAEGRRKRGKFKVKKFL
ncbi:MAG: hypothetical protein F6K39_19580 [Okeania sp. SIO3B3]|nr:hypothetical protein [Okeania sp. SIO3B3]